jgi:RNA polymerase sigma factor FliA
MNTITLWDAFRLTGDAVAREKLVAQHIGLVHHVARQLAASAGDDVDFNDIVSAGSIGLLQALDAFQPSRGLAFSTFAAARIRGAILDDRRRRDHVPRSMRQRQRAVKAASETLRSSLNREPTHEETANTLGLPLETYWSWRDDLAGTERVSLDRPAGNTDSPRSVVSDSVAGDTGQGTEERIQREQELRVLRAEMGGLREQERVVLALYFFEELKLHEIATVLGVTESRVSQIRTKALRTLRDRLEGLQEGER